MKIHPVAKKTAVLALVLVLGLLARAQQIDTWNGGGGGGSWDDAANWGGTAPNAVGDNLIFSGSVRPVSTNDFVTSVGWIDLNPSTAFTIYGIALTNNYAFTNEAKANVWNAPMVLGGEVQFNVASGTTVTMTNVISGGTGAGINLTGGGTLALNCVGNSYTGAVSVASSTLQLGSLTSTATYTFPGSALVAFNNATIYFNGSSGGTVTHTYNFPNLTAPIGITNSTLKFQSSNATTKQLNAAVNFNGFNTIAYTSSAYTHNLNFNQPISGGGTVLFNWSGTTSGRNININTNGNNFGGTIILNTTPAAGNFNLKNALGSAAFVISNAWTLVNAVTNGLDSAASITVSDSSATSGLNLTQYGWSNSAAPLTLNGGMVLMGNNSTGSTNYIGNLSGGGGAITNTGSFPSYLTVNQTSDAIFAGGIDEISGAPLFFTKDGPAALVLTGTNSYSGATMIDAGILEVDGELASTGVVVSANAILAGAGVLDGSVTVNASGALLANGNQPLTVNTLTLGASDSDNLTLTLSGDGTTVAGFVAVTGSDGFVNNGTVTVNVIGSLPPGANVFNLVTYTGTSTGSGTYVIGSLASGAVGYITNNTGAGAIQLVVTASDYLQWTGSPNNNWDLSGDDNWVSDVSGLPAAFGNTKRVSFDDSAASFAVNIAAPVAPGGIEVTNNANNYLFAGSGKITGSTTLTKDGTGTLTITTKNDFTGQIMINGGTLQLGDGTNNNGSLTGSVTNNAALVFANPGSQTYAGNISGTGTVTKQAAGALTVSGNNTYDGVTTVSAGTLVAGSGSALGSTNGDTVVTGGALDVNGQDLGAEEISISGVGSDGNGALVNNGAAQIAALESLALNGDATIGGSNRWDVRDEGTGAALNLDGKTLTKIGTNDIAMVGTMITDGSIVVDQGRFGLQLGVIFPEGLGQITVNSNGTLWVGDFGTPLQVSQPIVLNGGTIQADSGTIATLGSSIALATNSVINAGVPIYLTNIISGSGLLTKTGSSTLVFDAPTNTWTGGLVISSGVLQIGNNDGNGALPAAVTVVTNNGLLAYSLVNDMVFNQAMTGTGGLMQAGSDTITITNHQSYTGATVLQNGSLVLAGGDDTLSSATALGFIGNSTLNLGTNSQEISQLTINGMMTAAVVGSGKLSVTGPGDLRLGATTNSTPMLDMSGLSTFTYEESTNAFSVGSQASADDAAGTVNLALTNVITATRFGIADAGAYPGYTSTGIISLGQTNIINANTVAVGMGSLGVGGWAATGTLNFEPGVVNPSLVIRDSTGGGRANVIVGYCANSDYSAGSGTVDLVGGVNGVSTLDALVGSLIIGQHNYSNVNFSEGAVGAFYMADGLLDATNIVLGQKTYNAGKATSYAMGTFSLNGGTVKANTITIGDQVGGSGPSISGEFDLNSGLLFAGTIRAGAGNASRTFNWNDGTIQNYDDNTDLTISGLTLAINSGFGLPTLTVTAGRTGTISGSLSGNGSLVKTGAGTLFLDGDNSSYYGTLTNQAGAVYVDAPTSWGTIEVLANAILAGSSTVGTIQVDGGGMIQGGDVTGAGVLGASTLNLGALGRSTDVTYSQFNLSAAGQISATTLNVNGTNIINIAGPIPAIGTNYLILYSGAIGGNGFNGFKLGSLPGSAIGYLQDDPGVGIQLVITSALNMAPAEITSSINGSTLTLSWASDHLGWRLEAQTNSLGTGLTANWVTWPGSTNVTSVPVTMDPAAPAVFFRLVYP